MESVSLVFSCILNSEEIPLAEALGAIIILKVAFILMRAYFHGFAEVSTLKSRLKLKCLVYRKPLNRVISVRSLRCLFYFCRVNSVVWL